MTRLQTTRHLILVLGDQLDEDSAAFDGFDPARDVVWMAEVSGEAEYAWNHKARIVMFLSAMRHFRDALKKKGYTVEYHELSERADSFGKVLAATCAKRRPEKLIVAEPGEWRVRKDLEDSAREIGIELDIRADNHFMCTTEEFRSHAERRKKLRMEYFYREMRKKHDVLMENGTPAGGKWNYDADNRGSFGKEGPGKIQPTRRFKPDSTTREVIALVNRRFADHPGSLEHFDFPVTRADALKALDDFIKQRLSDFGTCQDAMWSGEPYLYHSRLSAALNLKLLNPREVIQAAENTYRKNLNSCPLSSVEGFIRQILGWREYVRGVYWLHMPEYENLNSLGAKRNLPEFYWSGETDMHCLQQTITQTLQYGYAHHIQRLMVTGLFALLYGVDPKEVHKWYLAMYVDAVEWVELPNTLGMSQYGDGGIMASKPYAATGKYIQRMSNYCRGCRYDPSEKTGDRACPFTTLYWDFLMRHEKDLHDNPRMKLQLRNLERLSAKEKTTIKKKAQALFDRY